LGNGEGYARDWVNVDHESCPFKHDETVDLNGPLPWPAQSITHVYAGHILEHLAPERCETLLAELLPLMVPGGQIMVVGPDVELVARYGHGTAHTMEEILHGSKRWPGDEHQWKCTTELVMKLLADAGWHDVTDVGIEHVPIGWPVMDRTVRWQLAVSARS